MSDDMKMVWKPGKAANLRPAVPENVTEYPKAVNGYLCHNLAEEESVREGNPLPTCQPMKKNFAESKPVPTGTPVEIQLKTQIIDLKVKVAELEAKNADLIRENERLKAGAKPKEAAKPAETPEPPKVVEKKPAATDDTVEIPPNWEDLHHQTKKSLARQIEDREPADTEDAENIIRASLKRRSGDDNA